MSWGGDTLVEGVEHVEGSREYIGVPVEIDATVQSATVWKKADRLGTASSTGRDYEKQCLHIYQNDQYDLLFKFDL